MIDIKPGQILYADLIFKNKKGEKLVAKKQIIAREYDGEFQTVYKKGDEHDIYQLKKFGINEDITLVDILTLVDLGMKNRPPGWKPEPKE